MGGFLGQRGENPKKWKKFQHFGRGVHDTLEPGVPLLLSDKYLLMLFEISF